MKKKNTSTRSNKRVRAKELARIREAITESYHDLSRVACDDRISTKPAGEPGRITMLPEGVKPRDVVQEPAEVDRAVDLLSSAINCLNREQGRKEKPPE